MIPCMKAASAGKHLETGLCYEKTNKIINVLTFVLLVEVPSPAGRERVVGAGERVAGLFLHEQLQEAAQLQNGGEATHRLGRVGAVQSAI